jgi:hypothetical protein
MKKGKLRKGRGNEKKEVTGNGAFKL